MTINLLPFLYKQIQTCQKNDHWRVSVVCTKYVQLQQLLVIIKTIAPKPMGIKSTSLRDGRRTIRFNNGSVIKICFGLSKFERASCLSTDKTDVVIIDKKITEENEKCIDRVKAFTQENGIIQIMDTEMTLTEMIRESQIHKSINGNSLPRELR